MAFWAPGLHTEHNKTYSEHQTPNMPDHRAEHVQNLNTNKTPNTHFPLGELLHVNGCSAQAGPTGKNIQPAMHKAGAHQAK